MASFASHADAHPCLTFSPVNPFKKRAIEAQALAAKVSFFLTSSCGSLTRFLFSPLI
jgi:hypothetical protein